MNAATREALRKGKKKKEAAIRKLQNRMKRDAQEIEVLELEIQQIDDDMAEGIE